MSDSNDLYYMKRALVLAQSAAQMGEVPVGAVIVYQNEIIAEAHNERETSFSSIGHAEILAIQQANRVLKSWRLTQCTMYVTLEPCTMCSGALVQARLQRLVFGATDKKAGAVTSLYQITDDPRLNHSVGLTRGVLESECGQVLKDFFAARRAAPNR